MSYIGGFPLVVDLLGLLYFRLHLLQDGFLVLVERHPAGFHVGTRSEQLKEGLA